MFQIHCIVFSQNKTLFTSRKKAGTVIGLSCNVACLLSLLIGPYMPKSARELRRQLGLDKDKQSSAYGYIPTTFSCLLPAGHAIRDPKPLFKKIEDKLVEELRKRHAGRQSSPEAETKKLDQLKINDDKSPPVNGVKSVDVAALEEEIAKQVWTCYFMSRWFVHCFCFSLLF